MKKFWLGNLDLNQHVHIVGAGISGLLAAYHFKKNKIDFTLYEATDRVGGKIQSVQSKFGLAETAANAIVLTPVIEQFLKELHLSYLPANKGLKRFIYLDGKLKSFPYISPIKLLKIAFRSLRKTPTISKDLKVQDFWSPLLGEDLTQNILLTAIQGIYGNTTSDLNFSLVFDNDFSFGEKSYYQYFQYLKSKMKGAKSVSFKGGMQDLIDALYDEVKENTVLNSQKLNIQDNSLICTDPYQAFELTKESSLKKIQLSEIHTHTIFTDHEIEKLKNSFGALFPKDPTSVMGILCNNQIFKDRGTSYTFISHQPLSSADIQSFLLSKKIINEKVKIIDSLSYAWKEGLPVYSQDLLKAQGLLDKSQYAYFGNYTSKISIRKMIESFYV